MDSLEDRARSNADRQRAAAEVNAQQLARRAAQSTQRGESKNPFAVRNRAALSELVQLATKHTIPPFPLRRVMLRPHLERAGFRRVTRYRLGYEQVAMAWNLGEDDSAFGNPSISIAVTENLRLYKVRPLARSATGTIEHVIETGCARHFCAIGNYDSSSPSVDLQADTDLPLEKLEVDIVRGPFGPRNMFPVFGPVQRPPRMDSLDPSRTWVEAAVEAAATAMLTGTYAPAQPGAGDLSPRGWEH